MYRFVAMCVVLGSAAGASAQAPLLTRDEFLKDWQVSRQFTQAVAEKMPEAEYKFKASEPEMTFGGLMTHIATSQTYRFAQLRGEKWPGESWKREKLDKAQILAYLNESFEYVLATIPKLTDEQLTKVYKVDWEGRPEVNGRQMMLNMLVHTAHHRAQAEVYLRIKGIEPPKYTF